jgi:hypothetical protein
LLPRGACAMSCCCYCRCTALMPSRLLLLARLRATHHLISAFHFRFPFPPLAAAASPRAYPSAASFAQTSIPRPLICCSPHVAAQLVSNLSLPSAALIAARFRHPPRSSVQPQPHRLPDSLHTRPSKRRATELPSRFRHSYRRGRSEPPWFRRVMVVVVSK